MSGNSPTATLRGRRILVVEDEMLISMMMEDLLSGHGCEIVGPAAQLKKAVKLATTETIDAAFLDLNIDGKEVYPVAEILTQRGIPFAFASGYGASTLKDMFRNRPTIQKPIRAAELESVLGLLLNEAKGRDRAAPTGPNHRRRRTV